MGTARIWFFLKSRKGAAGPWTWREVLIDGAIARCSEDIADYGKAVHHAIEHGFDPQHHYWLIRSGEHTTYYAPLGKSGERAAEEIPPAVRDTLSKLDIS